MGALAQRDVRADEDHVAALPFHHAWQHGGGQSVGADEVDLDLGFEVVGAGLQMRPKKVSPAPATSTSISPSSSSARWTNCVTEFGSVTSSLIATPRRRRHGSGRPVPRTCPAAGRRGPPGNPRCQFGSGGGTDTGRCAGDEVGAADAGRIVASDLFTVTVSETLTLLECTRTAPALVDLRSRGMRSNSSVSATRPPSGPSGRRGKRAPLPKPGRV